MNPICLNPNEPNVQKFIKQVYSLNDNVSLDELEKYVTKYTTIINLVTDNLLERGIISRDDAADLITLNKDLEEFDKNIQNAFLSAFRTFDNRHNAVLAGRVPVLDFVNNNIQTDSDAWWVNIVDNNGNQAKISIDAGLLQRAGSVEMLATKLAYIYQFNRNYDKFFNNVNKQRQTLVQQQATSTFDEENSVELNGDFERQVEKQIAKNQPVVVINNYRAPVMTVTKEQQEDVSRRLTPEKQQVVASFVAKIFVRYIEKKLKNFEDKIAEKAKQEGREISSVKAEIRRENEEYFRRLLIARDANTRDEDLEAELMTKIIPLTQLDVINLYTLQDLIFHERDMIIEALPTVSTKERKDMLQAALDNFPLMFNVASTEINQKYGLNIFSDLSNLQLNEETEGDDSETSENNIQNEEESVKEDFSRNGDHSKSSELSLSKRVRLLYQEIYQVNKNGQYVKDALNQKVPVDLSIAHAAVGNQLRFMIDVKDMIPLLQRMSQPWVKQLLDKLVILNSDGTVKVNNDGTPQIKDDDLFNSFFSSYRLYFQPMTVMYKDKKDGRYKTRNLGVTENVQYLMNVVRRNIATNTIQGTAQHSIYKGGKINVNKDIKQDVENLNKLNEDIRLKVNRSEIKDLDTLFETFNLQKTITDYLKNIGFEIGNDFNLKDEIKAGTINEKDDFNIYVNTLTTLIGSIYNIYNFTINKADNPDIDIVNNSRRDYLIIAQILSNTVKNAVETSTNEDGKNIYALGKPSYLSNMVQKIKQTVQDKTDEKGKDYYQSWINNTFGQIDFFKNQDTGEWRSDICEKLFGDNPIYKEIFDHTRLLKIDKSDYTDWSEKECNLALYNMYTSLPYERKSGNEQQAWFRMFLFSDSPAGDFIKFVKYISTSDKSYEDILIDKFYGLFNQERSRMRNVKERVDRRINGENITSIAGYDATFEDGKLKTAGGLVCRFLPQLNYLKINNSFNTGKFTELYPRLRGKSFIESMDYLDKNANELGITTDDLRDFFAIGYKQIFDSDFEKTYKSWFTSGSIEIGDNGFVNGMQDSYGEDIKLHSTSTEKLQRFLPSLLESTKIEISPVDKSFLEYINRAINSNTYISEDDLSLAIDTYNKYVPVESQIEFEHSPLWNALREYEMNFNFMTSQILQLCTTDIAFYGKVNVELSTENDYDFVFEHNDLNGGKTKQFYKITSDSTIKDLQKRFKELHAPSMKGNQLLGKYKQEYEKTVYLNDREITSLTFNEIKKVIESNETLTAEDKKSILKAFSEINVTDAQAYRSIESYENILGQMGLMTEEMKTALGNIKDGKFDRWDLGTVFQTLKPYVYTRVVKNSYTKTASGKDYKISVPTQHKNSEFALMVIHSAIAQSLNDSPVLKGLHEFMRKHKIDVVQFKSTTKVGLMGTLDTEELANSNNVVKTLESLCGINSKNPNGNPDKVHLIPMEDWGIQTETPEHIIDKRQLIGTQIRKLIMSDMPEDAKFTIGNTTLTKKEWIEKYKDIINQQIFDAFSEIDKRFNPKNPNAGLEIQKIIHESIATSYKYDSDLIEACTWNGTGFNIPLSDRCMTERVQELINSIVKNRVTKQKIRGGACIQVSDFGIEMTDKLKIKFKEDGGIDYIPCMMPLYSKDLFEKFVDEEGKINIKNIEKEAPELLKAIGYRVPTEDMYSMANLKIMGFTPIFNGSVIMLPSEITTIAGSDFDVDKLYLMLHDFKVEKYDMAKARHDFAKAHNKENYEATARLLSSIFGEDLIDEVVSDDKLANDFKKWFNKHCEDTTASGDYLYKLDPKNWKIRVSKYNYSKNAEEQSSSARNNGMIDMMYSVLQTPYAAKKVLNPGGFDPQKQASRVCNIIDTANPEDLINVTNTKTLEKAVIKLKSMNVKQLDAIENDIAKKNNPLSAETAVKLHQQNMAGASQVGIYANYNVLHTLLQQCDVEIAGDFIINGNKSRNKERPRHLGNITNGNGKYISKISAGYLAASVDNGKDPLLKGLNSTPDTANIIGFLSLVGYEPLEVGAFMTLPSVKKVFDAMTLNNLSFDEALNAARQSYIKEYFSSMSFEEIEKVKARYSSLSVDDMLLCKSYVSLNDVDKLDSSQQELFDYINAISLDSLEEIYRHSQELSQLLSVSRADTQNGGAGPLNIKNIDKEIKQEKIESKRLKIAHGKGDNYKIIIHSTPNTETFVGDFYKYGIASVRELFGRYFAEYSSVGRNLIYLIQKEYGIPEKLAKKLFDDWQKYNLMSTELFGKEGDLEISKKMEYYVRQFPNEFIKWKESLPSDIAQLTFVHNMDMEQETVSEPFKHLKLTDIGKTSSARERIKQDWLKLYEYDADMATKLFVYGGLRGGFGFNPKSYLHLAPAQLRMKMPKYVETVFNMNRNTLFTNFWRQFCRNNWQDKNVVPRLKDNDKFTKTVNEEGITLTARGAISETNRNKYLEEIKLMPEIVLDNTGNTPVLYVCVSRVSNGSGKDATTTGFYVKTTKLGLGDLYHEYNPEGNIFTSIFTEEDSKSAETDTDNVPDIEPLDDDYETTGTEESNNDTNIGKSDSNKTATGEEQC